MANYRMVLAQRWEVEAGSLRSRASSVVSTGTKFSFSTLAHEEHPNIDGILGRHSLNVRARPGSILSFDEPAPPYVDQEAMDPSQLSANSDNTVSTTQPSPPVVEDEVVLSSTPLVESENAASVNYRLVLRTLDEAHARELSQLNESHLQELTALRNTLAHRANGHYELLKQKHEQELARTHNSIDQTYCTEFRAKEREIKKGRQEAASQLAGLTQAHEDAIIKARNTIEDLWEGRWSDRMRIAAEEALRIDLNIQRRLDRAAKQIKDLVDKHPELAEELNSTVEELQATT